MLFLQIESLSVTFHGHELVVDSTLELNYGRYILAHEDSVFICPVTDHKFVSRIFEASR